MAYPTDDILGYPISTRPLNDIIREVILWLNSDDDKVRYIACVNPHSLEIARKDREFDFAIRSAQFIVPDGFGVILASKILGGSLQNRVTGMDLFIGLSRLLCNQKVRYSYFFLGSTEENLKSIEKKLALDFPHIRLAGSYSPPFKACFDSKENELMVEMVNKAAPDVLWVGMTAPKQEKWVYENKDRLNVKVIGPIGAVFDFYSGRIKRSHPFFQKYGLEWLPRFLREPRRLWRRNIISNPAFLWRVVAYRFGKIRGSRP